MARGRVRRAIALAILGAAVLLALLGYLEQRSLPPNAGLEGLGPIFDYVGAAILAVAAAFTWWFSRRDPGVPTMRLVGALGGAWLGGAVGLLFANLNESFEVWMRMLGLAPIVAWGEALGVIGLILGAALGAMLVRARADTSAAEP